MMSDNGVPSSGGKKFPLAEIILNKKKINNEQSFTRC